MASTFKELYDDFYDTVKIYTEQLDVTPVSFMRMFTRGMQLFQRETRYISAIRRLTRNDPNIPFNIPIDYLMPIEVKDQNGYTLLIQEPRQAFRNAELWQDGYLETPTDYSMRMQGYLSQNVPPGVTTGIRGERVEPTMHRMASIYNQALSLFPDYGDLQVDLYYYPDIHAFSISSPQWSTFNVSTGTYDPVAPLLWFPLNTQFQNMFRSSTVNILIAPYEDAFLDYAIARYLRSQSKLSYKEFMISFWEEVAKAKENKPVINREMVLEYMFAPYA